MAYPEGYAFLLMRSLSWHTIQHFAVINFSVQPITSLRVQYVSERFH